MFGRLSKGAHTALVPHLNNLELMRTKLGRLVDARPVREQTLAMSRRACSGDDENTALSLNHLGTVLELNGDAAAVRWRPSRCRLEHAHACAPPSALE